MSKFIFIKIWLAKWHDYRIIKFKGLSILPKAIGGNSLNKKMNRRENNLMTKMFLNYLILILIPFIFFSALFVNFSSENMRKSVLETNMRVLDSVRTSIDEKILSIQNLLFQLVRTKDVINTINISYNNTPLDIYTESKCMDIFNTVLTANTIFNEIFLYTPQNESVLTSSYKFYKDNADDISITSKNNMVLLISMLKQKPQNLGISSLYFEDNKGHTQLVILLPVKNSFGSIVSFGMIISYDELLNLLEEAKLTSGTDIAILNKNDKLLACTKGYLFENNSYLDTLGGTSPGDTIKLSEGSTLTYLSTKLLSLKIVSIIPAKSMSILSRNVLLLIVIMFLLLILDCIFLNYSIAKRIYRPVTAILELVKSSKSNHMGNNNDIGIIRDTLKTNMDKAIELETYVSNNLYHFCEKFLLELVTELSPDINTIYKKIEALKLQFPHKWFSVHIFHIYNYSLYKSIHGQEQAWYARNRLLEMLKKTEVPEATFLYGINDNKIIKLTNISDEFETCKSEDFYSKKHINISRDFYDEFGLEFCGAIGKYVEKITDVSQSYLCALDTLKKSFISNVEDIILPYIHDHENENESETYSYQYLFRDEDIITDMLVCGKSEGAIERMHLIIETNIKCGTNYEYIELLFTQLLTTAVRTVYESGYTLSDVYGFEYDIFSTLKLYDKTADIISFIEREYHNIGAFMQSRIDKFTITSYDLVKYISENYTKNIGLSDAAEHFGLSSPYFSKFFKSTMKCLFVDYLCQYRIQKALKLMKDSNKILKQIACDVGFINYKTFARSFHKVTSMTPEQYRLGKS